MRMLFKWVIPWSDRVYNAFSHVKSPLCCKPAQRQGRARAAPVTEEPLPPRRPQDNTHSHASPLAAQKSCTNLLNLEECLHWDISSKKQNYFSLQQNHNLFVQRFDAHGRARITLLTLLLFTNRNDTLAILQSFCFIEQNKTWKWYLLFELFCSTWKMN